MTLAEFLPALNATLNATSFVLLVAGRSRIRAGDVAGHRRRMVLALWVSGAFLASYLLHHALHGSRRFEGPGAVRAVYLVVLGSHTILAALLALAVPRVVWLALKDRREQHRRLARRVYPVWLYVSVTGVVIYLMLYHLSPALTGR